MLTSEQWLFWGRLTLELSLIYVAVVFAVGVLRRSISEVRLRRWLRPKRPVYGMAAAAGVGALVPFCSCSTVPLVAAMQRGGVAMPVLTTFLVMSPLVNPATLALLAAVASWQYAVVYLVGSALVALAVGATVGGIRWKNAASEAASGPDLYVEGWGPRAKEAAAEAWADSRKFVPILVIAAFVAALLRDPSAVGWLRSALAGADWWMIPVAAVVGVPVYASTAVLLPLGATLYGAGATLGVVTAFLMGATGLSIPEGIMLSKFLGARFVGVLAAAFTGAVIVVGFAIEVLP